MKNRQVISKLKMKKTVVNRSTLPIFAVRSTCCDWEKKENTLWTIFFLCRLIQLKSNKHLFFAEPEYYHQTYHSDLYECKLNSFEQKSNSLNTYRHRDTGSKYSDHHLDIWMVHTDDKRLKSSNIFNQIIYKVASIIFQTKKCTVRNRLDFL